MFSYHLPCQLSSSAPSVTPKVPAPANPASLKVSADREGENYRRVPKLQMSATKELARELGFLRTRNLGSDEKVTSAKASLQSLSHLLVLDFESTCWPDKTSSFPPEIIEFPVVLLCLSTGRIVSEFQQYVMPTEHPKLSSFCTELTGIRQETVDAGVPLPTALVLYNQWLAEVSRSFLGSGTATCCTWSDWDLNLCLENECKRKQVKKPASLNSWVDIRAVYRSFYGRRPQGLNGAIREVGLSFEGREHSGIDDARNTARLVWKMVKDGCLLQETGSTLSLREKQLGHRYAPAGSSKRRDWRSSKPMLQGVTIGPEAPQDLVLEPNQPMDGWD